MGSKSTWVGRREGEKYEIGMIYTLKKKKKFYLYVGNDKFLSNIENPLNKDKLFYFRTGKSISKKSRLFVCVTMTVRQLADAWNIEDSSLISDAVKDIFRPEGNKDRTPSDRKFRGTALDFEPKVFKLPVFRGRGATFD